MSANGILTVYLKEDYSNVWEEDVDSHTESTTIDATVAQPLIMRKTSLPTPVIEGPAEAYPYDIVEYKVRNSAPGAWVLSNGKAQIIESNESSVKVKITTGKSGSVSLIYKIDGGEDIIYNISILSL